MSAETATLIASGVAVVGTLLGVVVGLVVEDRLRRRGEVRRKVRAWSDGFAGGPGGNPEGRGFDIRFFNDRDVNISLWDPRVEFSEKGRLVEPPMVPTTGPRGGTEIGPIDLPSRTSVSVTMHVAADGERLARLKRADRVRFVAIVVPTGEKLSEDLRPWEPFVLAPP